MRCPPFCLDGMAAVGGGAATLVKVAAPAVGTVSAATAATVAAPIVIGGGLIAWSQLSVNPTAVSQVAGGAGRDATAVAMNRPIVAGVLALQSFAGPILNNLMQPPCGGPGSHVEQSAPSVPTPEGPEMGIDTVKVKQKTTEKKLNKGDDGC